VVERGGEGIGGRRRGVEVGEVDGSAEKLSVRFQVSGVGEGSKMSAIEVVGRAVAVAAVFFALCGMVADSRAEEAMVVGRIWTGDPSRPWVEAVGIRGEKIVAVGARGDVAAKLGAEARVIRAGNGIVVPGMYDAHIHLIDGGLHLASVQLREAKTKDEFVRRIGEFAAKHRERGDKSWVTGGDWDHTVWGAADSDGELPDRAWIDAVTGDVPVWVSRLDGHMALANTAAMRAAGVSDDVRDVEGGEIVRDAAGRPTGVFKDNAMGLIGHAEPAASLERRIQALVAAMKYLAEQGVTSVHHMGTWDDVQVFRVAHERGLLTTRIYAFTPLAEWQRLATEVEVEGRGDEWLSIGGLKGYVDGSLGSHTAAFLQAYSDDANSLGLLVNSSEDLEAWTVGADAAGLQVAVHAIGDRAIRLQLNVFERAARRNGARDRRFRVEHAQHIAADDVARFRQQGVIASMQPYHAIDDGRWAGPLIGPTRSETSYAFRSLLESGGRMAFGSDWYVAPATPLEGIDAAVNRRTLDGKNPDGWVPEQKIAAEDALRAYTSGAAQAGFQEASRGTIEVGKLADLVVIDRDVLKDDADIAGAKVKLTMVGGKIVFESGE
jgi:predicted amidohydrolase YtcJ